MAPLQRDESGDLGCAPRPREGRDREDRGFRGQGGSQRHREPAAGVGLKSNMVPRTNRRSMKWLDLHAWAHVELIVLMEPVEYNNCTYFLREHMCIRIVFLKR